MAAVDKFQGDTGVIAPLDRIVAHTPHDTTECIFMTRAVVVGTDGNLVVVTRGGDTVTIAVKAGIVYPFRLKIIKTTGHTAGTVWICE